MWLWAVIYLEINLLAVPGIQLGGIEIECEWF